MNIPFPINPTELRTFNLIRYKGIPPDWSLVEKTIKKSKIKYMEWFEAAFGLPKKTLIRYRMGDRGLPPVYWHIFYDFEKLESSLRSSKTLPRKVTKKQLDSNKNILNDLSTRVKG